VTVIAERSKQKHIPQEISLVEAPTPV